jgi:hypothetical protein
MLSTNRNPIDPSNFIDTGAITDRGNHAADAKNTRIRTTHIFVFHDKRELRTHFKDNKPTAGIAFGRRLRGRLSTFDPSFLLYAKRDRALV